MEHYPFNQPTKPNQTSQPVNLSHSFNVSDSHHTHTHLSTLRRGRRKVTCFLSLARLHTHSLIHSYISPVPVFRVQPHGTPRIFLSNSNQVIDLIFTLYTYSLIRLLDHAHSIHSFNTFIQYTSTHSFDNTYLNKHAHSTNIHSTNHIHSTTFIHSTNQPRSFNHTHSATHRK